MSVFAAFEITSVKRFSQVIQKLFEYGTALQKNTLCGQLETNVLSLSLDMYGCRVIQKVRNVARLLRVLIFLGPRRLNVPHRSNNPQSSQNWMVIF
jgi:hypothetical protein